MKREHWIDICKGIGIVLMVLGHTIQYCNGNEYLRDLVFTQNKIYLIIYSFHMPLFIFISGYLAHYSCEKSGALIFIKNKIIEIMTPLLFWCFLFYITENTVSSWNIYDYMVYTTTHLWFLWAVLYCSLALAAIHYLCNDNYIVPILIIIVSFIIYDYGNSIYFKMMFPIYILGYYFNKLRLIDKLQDKKTVLVISCIYLLLLFVVVFKNSTYIFVFTFYSMNNFANIYIVIVRLIINAFGTLCIIAMVYNLCKVKSLPLTTYLGKNSIGIYVLNSKVREIYLNFVNYLPHGILAIMYNVAMLVIFVFVSALITHILLKEKHIRFITLGKH